MITLKPNTRAWFVRIIFSFAPAMIVFFWFFSSARKFDRAAQEGFDAITPDLIRQHIAVLASDSLEGRGTGTPGGWKAASYIAGKFRELGIKPLGDSGSYYQRLDFFSPRIDQQASISVRSKSGSSRFAIDKDFYPPMYGDIDVTAPVVFVGYSDARYDSSTTAKMAGKIVIMLSGPRSLANDTSWASVGRKEFLYNFSPSCAATLLVCDEYGSASYQAIVSKAKSYHVSMGHRMLFESNRSINYFKSLYISSRLAEAIFRSSGYTLEQMRRKAINDTTPSAVFLDRASVTIDSRIGRDSRRSDNVIGYIEGSDPDLRGETVAFSAHYDHLGITSDGAIYRGADDNGSGSAALLAIAKAYALNPNRPRRSILFMSFTAEELGLVGSAFYAVHPLGPLDSLSAVIDMDMIGRADNSHEKNPGSSYLYVLGSDRVNEELDVLLNLANHESENLSLDYRFDSRKDPNHFFERSDTWNFAKLGIPVVQFFTGIHKDYHRTTDTPDKILYDKAARIARLAYYTSWKLANTPNHLRPDLRAGNPK